MVLVPGDPDHVSAATDDTFSYDLLNLEAVFASFRQISMVLHHDQCRCRSVRRQLHTSQGYERRWLGPVRRRREAEARMRLVARSIIVLPAAELFLEPVQPVIEPVEKFLAALDSREQRGLKVV